MVLSGDLVGYNRYQPSVFSHIVLSVHQITRSHQNLYHLIIKIEANELSRQDVTERASQKELSERENGKHVEVLISRDDWILWMETPCSLKSRR